MKRRSLARTTIVFFLLLFFTMGLAATALAATHDVTTEAELQSAVENAAEGDTIRLTADIDLTETLYIPEEKSIILDLNNRVLRQATKGEIVIYNDGTLTIRDSSSSKTKKYFERSGDLWSLTTKTTQYAVSGGVITGGNIGGGEYDGNDGAAIRNWGKLIIEGGAVAGNSNVGEGSRDGVIVNGKEFSMTGGEICYNFATDSGAGIVIYRQSTSTIISGGKIHDNVASMGGGISVERRGQLTITGSTEIFNNTATGLGGGGIGNQGTLNITGGKIYKNKCTATEDVCFGGGIGNIGTLNVTGGEICNNEAQLGGGIGNVTYLGPATAVLTGGTVSGNKSTLGFGGGVLVMASTVLGGSIKITGNTANGSANNLFLGLEDVEMTVTVSTDKKPSSMSVGVTTKDKPTEGNPVPVTETNNANYSRFFKSDEGYSVINEGNVVKLAVGAPVPVPETGDDNNPLIFAALLLMGAAGALFMLRRRNEA